jgi:hypothetical protein
MRENHSYKNKREIINRNLRESVNIRAILRSKNNKIV